MNCDLLPNTGLDATTPVIFAIGLACVLVGLWIVRVARGRRARSAAALLLLVLVVAVGGVAIGIVPSAPAMATPSECATYRPDAPKTTTQDATEENSLTIVQTSTMNGIAPGVAPAAITGRVLNNGFDSTFIVAITVNVVSVEKGAGPAVGPCDASDYVLLDVRMPVGRMLGPREATTFGGASIGFNDKSTNQDACKGATIHLRYVTAPA
jgi:LPXTG-motif cell wall-anchored protein